ncbi:glutathione S-transferase U9-like [Zingiber officinale]|uniref:glutathione S-transferase U9-like n=1 Tax=Zingiber officinale TaxID=94328 RepID=UPI001C4CA089|nr:glutathione S-transferase U9-like [Zingiber officinale]
MANAKEVRLYGMTRSGYCLMVHHALRLKGVPYDYVEEDLKNKSQELLRLNPVHKKVPVLVVDGRPVAESLVILQYIDELWGSLAPRLLPEDPHRRAKVRFWADFVYQKVVPLTYVIPKAEGDSKAAAVAEFRAQLVAMEAGVGEELWVDGAGPFINGDAPGLLDLLVGSCHTGIKFLEGVADVQLLDKEETPLLCSIMEAFLQLDVVKETTDFLQQHVHNDR